MSQASFEIFMHDQWEAIERSGMEPEAWIAANAETFRNEWEKAHAE